VETLEVVVELAGSGGARIHAVAKLGSATGSRELEIALTALP